LVVADGDRRIRTRPRPARSSSVDRRLLAERVEDAARRSRGTLPKLDDEKSRARWFPKGKLEVTSATDQKYFRGKWNGGTRLEINVYAKGDDKSQIAVQHSKFPDANTMEAMRAEWKKALAKLASAHAKD
jgi:hypothetical protein